MPPSWRVVTARRRTAEHASACQGFAQRADSRQRERKRGQAEAQTHGNRKLLVSERFAQRVRKHPLARVLGAAGRKADAVGSAALTTCEKGVQLQAFHLQLEHALQHAVVTTVECVNSVHTARQDQKSRISKWTPGLLFFLGDRHVSKSGAAQVGNTHSRLAQPVVRSFAVQHAGQRQIFFC